MADIEALFEHIPHPHLATRAEQGPVKVADQHRARGRIGRINARLAVWLTRVVGTMWCFYAFNLLASASAKTAFETGNPTIIINWVSSNWLQLILLPALLVGQDVQARAADKRAEQTYLDTEAILHELHEVHRHIDTLSGTAPAGDESGGDHAEG